MQDKQKQAVIDAIGQLGRRVTAADVATKTGMPLLTVQQKLNQVAADTGGNLQVGQSGDIVYSFAPGFSNKYLSKGIAAALLLIGAKVMHVLFYLVRISFGIALILSLITIVVLLIAMAVIMSRGMSSDRDDRGGSPFGNMDWGGGGFHFSFWDWMILRDLLYWNMYSSPGTVTYRYDQPTVRKRPQSNFLFNCFSFLFGDGDPNEGIKEKQWQVVAQAIKQHDNVVTAEELAPYTGAAPENNNAALPALVRFNGRPEVTDSGNIVYVFESMQSKAVAQSVHPPSYLKEFPFKFTNVPEGELLPVYIVAGLNFFGAWTLQSWVARAGLTHSFGTLTTILCVYGTLFIAIPILRTIVNGFRNAQIEGRNEQREKYAQQLAKPTAELSARLAEARNFNAADRYIKKTDVVYTTEKDSLDQADELSEKFEDLESHQSAEAQSSKKQKLKADEDAGKKIKLPKQSDIIDMSP